MFPSMAVSKQHQTQMHWSQCVYIYIYIYLYIWLYIYICMCMSSLFISIVFPSLGVILGAELYQIFSELGTSEAWGQNCVALEPLEPYRWRLWRSISYGGSRCQESAKNRPGTPKKNQQNSHLVMVVPSSSITNLLGGTFPSRKRNAAWKDVSKLEGEMNPIHHEPW